MSDRIMSLERERNELIVKIELRTISA